MKSITDIENCFNLFKEDVIDKIKDNDEFQSYIELIHLFNGMKYDKPSPNPRINQRNKITNDTAGSR